MILSPEIEGTVAIRSSGERFVHAFRQRVAVGLLTGRPHPRSNYVVSDAGPGHLVVRAVDWWTAINVGLNRLELREFIWPWLLSSLHKRPVRGLVARLIAEVDAGAAAKT
jgi:hypothetical protein